jgi:hypothetical protein
MFFDQFLFIIDCKLKKMLYCFSSGEEENIEKERERERKIVCSFICNRQYKFKVTSIKQKKLQNKFLKKGERKKSLTILYVYVIIIPSLVNKDDLELFHNLVVFEDQWITFDLINLLIDNLL